METKICTKCKIEKVVEDFSKCKSNKGGLQYHCKLCAKQDYQNYYIKNRERRLLKMKEYFAKPENRERTKQRSQKYVAEHKEELKQYNQKYHNENKEKLKQYDKERYATTEYRIKNNFYRKQYNSIPKNKIISNLRRRMRCWLHSTSATKGKSMTKLVGCSQDELLNYLESKFTPGMTREGLLDGSIHIDHIRPCSSYDPHNKEDIADCFHWTNLQVLWKADNRSKGDYFPAQIYWSRP